MSRDHQPDPLLEWGLEAAVIVFVAGILAALAIIIYSVMEGGSLESSAPTALAVAGIGTVAALGIMVLRKRRERAPRPAWMGTTQEWGEDMHARRQPPEPPEKA